MAGVVTVPAVERFWSFVDQTAGGCWLWTGAQRSTGYGCFSIDGHQRAAHRVSYEWAFEPVPDGMFVCHRCDTRLCVRPSHLFLGSAADNSSDMVTKGRAARGEANGRAKLTADQVEVIRRRRLAGERGAALAREFNISESAVCAIHRGRLWVAA